MRGYERDDKKKQHINLLSPPSSLFLPPLFPFYSDFCYDAQADGSCKNTCANPQNNNCTGTNDHFYISRGYVTTNTKNRQEYNNVAKNRQKLYHTYLFVSRYRLVPGTVCDPAKGLNLLPKRISCKCPSTPPPPPPPPLPFFHLDYLFYSFFIFSLLLLLLFVLFSGSKTSGIGEYREKLLACISSN